jgi:endonuclease/exonuclease/phosphatase family metal-dependent hydrolase
MSIRLATYNIHRCFGRDGRYDADRIIAVLREIDADIVALQEVESSRDAGLDLLARFERETGMQSIAGPTIHAPDATYGNAVLTRLPVARIERIDLSCHRREARGALAIEFENPPGLYLLATHFGLKGRERMRQARRLCDEIDRHPDLTPVVAGDINEWQPFAPALRCLRNYFGSLRAPATFPSHLPLLSLDRILARPRNSIQRLERHRSPLARIASDHLPLVAELNIAGD